MLTLIVFVAAFVLIFVILALSDGYAEYMGAPKSSGGAVELAALSMIAAGFCALLFQGAWSTIEALSGFFGMGG